MSAPAATTSSSTLWERVSPIAKPVGALLVVILQCYLAFTWTYGFLYRFWTRVLLVPVLATCNVAGVLLLEDLVDRRSMPNSSQVRAMNRIVAITRALIIASSACVSVPWYATLYLREDVLLPAPSGRAWVYVLALVLAMGFGHCVSSFLTQSMAALIALKDTLRGVQPSATNVIIHDVPRGRRRGCLAVLDRFFAHYGRLGAEAALASSVGAGLPAAAAAGFAGIYYTLYAYGDVTLTLAAAAAT